MFKIKSRVFYEFSLQGFKTYSEKKFGEEGRRFMEKLDKDPMKINKFRGYRIFENELNVLKELEEGFYVENFSVKSNHVILLVVVINGDRNALEQYTLPESIGNLINLEKLDLQDKYIINLPDSIYNLSLLKELRIVSDKLIALTESIGNLQNLEKIDLQDGAIIDLPNSIGNLSLLKELRIASNQLTTLPESIGNLQNLRTLNLSSNLLTTLPESIGNLQNLQILSLTSNQLTTLPESIGSLQNLRTLNLSSNLLTTLPESISNLQNLQELNLGFERKTDLPDFVLNIPIFKKHRSNKNNLKNLPNTIGNLQNLQILNLEFNQLTTLPDSMVNLQNLQKLNLDSNQLTDLPKSIGSIQNLQELGLKFNRLNVLPESFYQLKNLNSLTIEGNKWKSEWKDILKLDIKSILKLSRKLNGLSIFISHAWLDQEKYNVVKIKNILENKIVKQEDNIHMNIIHNVFICEEDVIDDIQEFMKRYVPKSDLLIFIATNNSLESKACKFELSLAKEYGIKILPLKGIDLSWHDLGRIDLNIFNQGILDLSDPNVKYEFTEQNFSETCNDICQYILSHELELKKMERLLDISEEIVEDFGDITLDIIKSLDFMTVMRENYNKFKELIQKIIEKEIFKLEFFSRLVDLFNEGFKLSSEEKGASEKVEKQIQIPLSQTEISKLDPNEAKAFKDLERILDESIPKVEKVGDHGIGVKIDGENIIELSLSFNYLSNLPECIGEFRKLKVLLLHSTYGLTSLPKSIGNLKSLTTLDLASNKLNRIPEIVYDLPSLKKFIISYNELKTFPKLINNLKSLTTLDLASNKFYKIPKIQFNLPSLESLDLSNTELITLPDSIGNLSSLKELKLLHNKFVTLPKSITALTSLKRLALGRNQLKKIPDSIGNLTSLTDLALFRNKLTTLPESIGNLSSLKELNLMVNRLSTLPKSITALTSLEKLSLNINKLKKLPRSLWRCNKLKTLTLNDNPWNKEWKGIENSTIPTVLELCKQRDPINISIIFASDDQDKYSINALSKNLESYEEIKKVYKNEEKALLDSQIILYFATRTSILDELCKSQLRSAFSNGISIIPIKGEDLSWEDLTQINTEIDFNLSDKLGFEFKSKKKGKFYSELYDHITKFKRSIDVFQSEEKIFEEEWKKFIIIIENFIISKEFIAGIKENIEQSKQLLQEFNGDKITLSTYLIKLTQILKLK